MLKPGTYSILHDVQNPYADRRKKDDWRAWPVWKAGSEFMVISNSNLCDYAPANLPQEALEKLRAKAVSIRMVNTRYAALWEVGPGDKARFKLLCDILVPCVESYSAFFARLDVDQNEYFARWLVESGRLDRELFQRLWTACNDDGELPAKAWPRQGRRLVEEADSEELGVESSLEALNRVAEVSK